MAETRSGGAYSQQPHGALQGIKILSFAQVGVGPAAVQLMADLGADVIKVERPQVGAWERGWSGPRAFIKGESLFFLGFNRNQRSLTVNLKHPRGKEIVYRLVPRMDLMVENYRPGVMDQLGLGYETLAEINPRIIYCSATGFGPEGPYKNRPGQDLILQSESGLASITGRKQDPPTPTGAPIVDMHAAALLAFGVVSALLCRERTGVGQKVETSLLEAALHLQLEPLMYFLNGRWLRERSEEGLGSTYHAAPYGIYETKDGYLALSITPVDKLADALGLPELKAFSEKDAHERPDEIKRVVQKVVKTKRTGEWLEILLAQDIWCGSVNTYGTLEHHPQLVALDVFQAFEHPKAGKVKTLRHPVRYSQTPARLTRYPPLLGEHTEEVLKVFGYSEQEIKELVEAGAV